MSITTRTGDTGETSLMFGRRVPKNSLQVCAYGDVDELSAALGMARASLESSLAANRLEEIQQDLIKLMGELAVGPEDKERYRQDDRFPKFTGDLVDKLDQWCKEIEAAGLTFKGWALPGSSPSTAFLDLARTVCRRAERSLVTYQEKFQQPTTPAKIVYLNRLSDLLWLVARAIEQDKLPQS